MGNLTPNPIIQQINIKFISNLEKLKLLATRKDDDSQIKKETRKQESIFDAILRFLGLDDLISQDDCCPDLCRGFEPSTQ